jgi:hypothetical protein
MRSRRWAETRGLAGVPRSGVGLLSLLFVGGACKSQPSDVHDLEGIWVADDGTDVRGLVFQPSDEDPELLAQYGLEDQLEYDLAVYPSGTDPILVQYGVARIDEDEIEFIVGGDQNPLLVGATLRNPIVEWTWTQLTLGTDDGGERSYLLVDALPTGPVTPTALLPTCDDTDCAEWTLPGPVLEMAQDHQGGMWVLGSGAVDGLTLSGTLAVTPTPDILPGGAYLAHMGSSGAVDVLEWVGNFFGPMAVSPEGRVAMIGRSGLYEQLRVRMPDGSWDNGETIDGNYNTAPKLNALAYQGEQLQLAVHLVVDTISPFSELVPVDESAKQLVTLNADMSVTDVSSLPFSKLSTFDRINEMWDVGDGSLYVLGVEGARSASVARVGGAEPWKRSCTINDGNHVDLHAARDAAGQVHLSCSLRIAEAPVHTDGSIYFDEFASFDVAQNFVEGGAVAALNPSGEWLWSALAPVADSAAVSPDGLFVIESPEGIFGYEQGEERQIDAARAGQIRLWDDQGVMWELFEPDDPTDPATDTLLRRFGPR